MSSSDNNCTGTLATVADALEQRREYLLGRTPFVRNEIVSPYPTFTKMQLDMRRKVEVLKYKKNSTQARNLTAKEKQAQILRGNYRGNVLYCADDKNIPVKTSSLDVPGPIITLQEDPSVPLYNYITNQFSPAVSFTESDEKWSLSILPNVTVADSTDTIIATLLVKDAIDNTTYYYTYSTPYVLTIEGNNIPIDASGETISITINNPRIKVLYQSTELANSESNTNSNFVTSIENTSVEVKLEPDSSNTNTFSYSAQIYLGTITLSNIYVDTYPGISYNFALEYVITKQINTDTNPDSIISSTDINTTTNNTTVNIITNLDNYSVLASSECTITTPTEESSTSAVISFEGTQTI
jgi:hypothetical protein